MVVWETDPSLAAQSPLMRDFAEVWQAADKIVYSTTLEKVSTRKTRIERSFDPAAVERLEADTDHDITIAGPGLAAHAFEAGLIDEVHLYLSPVMVGGGEPGLPRGARAELELLDQRRFANGVVHVRYRTMT